MLKELELNFFVFLQAVFSFYSLTKFCVICKQLLLEGALRMMSFLVI